MNNNHLIALLFSCITIGALSQQDSVVSLNQLKAQIREFSVPPPADFTYDQRTLLKAREKEKINAELSILASEKIILSGDVYNWVRGVFKKIVAANPGIPASTELVLYESSEFNAFTMGSNVVFVNSGLLADIHNEDELALVLSHEIAHNSLQHIQQTLIAGVLSTTNESLKQELENAAKQDYGNVSALNRVMAPRIMASREISRNNEFDADSLGAVYFMNTGFNLERAVAIFSIMDYYSGKGDHPLTCINVLPEESKELFLTKDRLYKRTSSLGVIETDSEDLVPYLMTHPYDVDRFKILAKNHALTGDFEDYAPVLDSAFLQQRKSVLSYATDQMLETQNWSKAFYKELNAVNVLSETDRYRLAAMFSCLSFLKERRLSGKYLSRQNPKQPEDFDRLCAILNALSPQECRQISQELIGEVSLIEENPSVEKAVSKLIELALSGDEKTFELYWTLNKDKVHDSAFSIALTEVEDYLYQVKRYTFIKTTK